MCLVLTKKSSAVVDQVYKVYRVNRVISEGYQYDLRAFLQGNSYNFVGEGTVIKSDRTRKTLTAQEKRDKRVSSGLHAFLNLEDALSAANKKDNSIVVRLSGLRTDRVAVGKWDNSSRTNCGLYKQLTVDKFVTYFEKAGVPVIL